MFFSVVILLEIASTYQIYPKVQNLFFQWDRLMLFVVTGPVQLALFELCFDFSFTWIMFYYIIDYLCYMSGVQQET